MQNKNTKETKKIDLHPKKCNICGGLVIYTNNNLIYGKSYGSGKCYLCTQCGSYVGTHEPRPTEALGLLADSQMRTLKKKCHSIFDEFWNCGSNGKQRRYLRNMAYKRLATMMRIPLEECHFGYFDLLQLKKAYNCCQVLKKRSETYTWEHTDVTKKWLEAKAAGDKEIHDHIGSVRIGTLCFDLIERKGKRDKNYLYADLYVGGIDTGYGYGKDDYPYTYVDWISRRWTVDKLPKDYRSFKKEIEEKLTMLIKHARSITLKRKQYSLQEKILDDVKIW